MLTWNTGVRQVAKVEFLMFVLDRLELVGQDEMNRILEMFDEADEVGDGVLNLQVQQASHQHTKSRSIKSPVL